MMREDMLARLLSQAATQGSDLVTLRAVVEEASELGANRVLVRMGLDDPDAREPILPRGVLRCRMRPLLGQLHPPRDAECNRPRRQFGGAFERTGARIAKRRLAPLARWRGRRTDQ